MSSTIQLLLLIVSLALTASAALQHDSKDNNVQDGVLNQIVELNGDYHQTAGFYKNIVKRVSVTTPCPGGCSPPCCRCSIGCQNAGGK
jgi:hypothetical protein